MGLYFPAPEVVGIMQTASALLAVNTTTTPITYVDLLTVTLTTMGATRLEVYASLSASNTMSRAATNQDYLRLTVDSTVLTSGGNEQWPVTEASALFCVTDVLSAGSHTVHLQWHTDTGGTLRCSAGTIAAQPEHASLVIIETNG